MNHIVGDCHYLALGLEPRRTVLTIHDCATLERLRGVKRMLFRWAWFAMPVRRAAIVTTVSESTRREVLRHIRCSSDKLRVVHNCAASAFQATPKAFNQHEPVILQVGTGQNKNLERVVRALEGIPCKLNIIGRLSDKQLAALAHNQVRYSNIVKATDDQVVAAYRDCDVVVFASTYEGFGMPIVEANAVGRPVVTSSVLSMPEVAANAALFVDPFDVGSIRRAVRRLIAEPVLRESLVAAGFKNVQRFSPQKIAGQYAAIYEEVAAGA